MKLEMPDGSKIILVHHDEGVVVATQAAPVAGTAPPPSGKIVTGETANLLGALIEAIEDADIEEVLGGDSLQGR